jgi:hypothetical protein
MTSGPLDSWLQGWEQVGVPVQERHTAFAESAQGVATDGQRWFVVSNRAQVGLMRKITAPTAFFDPRRNSRRVGIYRTDGTKTGEVGPDPAIWAELLRRNVGARGGQPIHFGDPCWARDTLLVPTQRPSGVWLLSDDLTRQDWWADPAPTWPERFSWIAHEPGSDLLYTSLHWHPDVLHALRWETLEHVPEADLHLAPTDPKLDRVQGGAFFDAGHVLLTSSEAGGRVYAFSTSDGSWLGMRQLGGYHEMEGIAVHRHDVGGQPADVHILEAATDYWPFVKWGDSFAVRSYRVPTNMSSAPR